MHLWSQPDVGAEVERQLRKWVIRGACQGPSGAFHAWRDPIKSQLSYEYPEITGYALTYQAGLRSDGQKDSSVMLRAAEWLERRIAVDDFTARYQDGATVYNFDLAMMASGLMNAGRSFGIESYVLAGVRLTEIIKAQLFAEGKLTAISGSRSPNTRVSSWSTDGAAHLLKVVQCLLIAESLGLNDAEEAAGILVRSLGSIQESTGRLRTHPADSDTWLHPLLYGAEGLWIWGVTHGDSVTLERAAAAVNWVWSYQLPSGGFPCTVNHRARRPTGPEQSDVTCQVVRLTLLLNMASRGLQQALARIVESTHSDNIGTALVYRPTSGLLHQNTWCTIFGAQALAIRNGDESQLGWSILA